MPWGDESGIWLVFSSLEKERRWRGHCRPLETYSPEDGTAPAGALRPGRPEGERDRGSFESGLTKLERLLKETGLFFKRSSLRTATAPILRLPLLVGNCGDPQYLLEVDKEDRVREAVDKTLAGLLVIMKRKCQGIQLDTPNGLLDFLPELASEPGPLPLVKENSLMQVPLGIRVEEDPFH
jgi:hypothetical protein